MRHDYTGELSNLQYYERSYYFTNGAMDFFHSAIMRAFEGDRYYIILERLRDSHDKTIYRVDVLDKKTGEVVVYAEGKREKMKKLHSYLVADYLYNKGLSQTPAWMA